MFFTTTHLDTVDTDLLLRVFITRPRNMMRIYCILLVSIKNQHTKVLSLVY